MISKVQFSSNFQSQNITKNRNEIAFKGAVADLEPKDVWKHFDAILPIYRESGHCQEISDHLAKKLTGYGFDVKQEPDNTGQNYVIATKNLDKGSPVILQAHMDMVGVSDDKNPRKPIIPTIEGSKLRANDRTLGADDGLGLAMALAIAEKTTTDSRFKDLPLKILFTTDEEIGCMGAKALKKEEFAGSKYLINLDSEESYIFTNGCAGSDRYIQEKIIPMYKIGDKNHEKVSITLKNASGGHSGLDINQGRINPIKAVLSELNKINNEDNGIRLMTISGGEKSNSIPKSVKVELLVPQEKTFDVISKLNHDLKAVKEQHKNSDPGLTLQVKTDNSIVNSDTKVVSPDFQEKLFRILGEEVLSDACTFYDNGDTKTSQNLGVLELKNLGNNGKLSLTIMGRSSDEAEGKKLKDKTSSQLSELLNKAVKPNISNPIWQPKLDSLLTQIAVEEYKKIKNGEPLNDSQFKMMEEKMPNLKKNPKLEEEVYKKLNNGEPIVRAVHAGLEDADFAEKVPELDQMSMGTDMDKVHSVAEYTLPESMKTSYPLLENILLRLKSELMGQKDK